MDPTPLVVAAIIAALLPAVLFAVAGPVVWAARVSIAILALAFGAWLLVQALN